MTPVVALALVLLKIVFITPTMGIISCVICNDCTNPNSIMKNQTCLTAEDTCMKLDFGTYAYKKCGIQSTMCTKDGFKRSNSNLWNQIQLAVGSIIAENELEANVNAQSRYVLNCCQDRDFCNKGPSKILNLLTVFGVVTTYVATIMPN